MTDPRDPALSAPAPARPAKGGRRGRLAILAVAVVLVLGALAYVLSSIPLSLSAARSEIEARLMRLTGAPVEVDGAATFSLLPRPRVTLSDVRVRTGAQGEEALELEVDRLEADFDLFDALTGRADIKRVTLIRPELGPAEPGEAPPPPSAAPDADASAPPSSVALPGATRRASQTLASLLVRFEGLDEVRIRDGLFRIPGIEGGFSNANLVFEWRREGAPATLSGSYVWNGQPSEITARLDQPLGFFAGTPGPLQFTFASPSLASSFSGSGAAGERLLLSGALRLSAPSLSRAVRWLGEPTLTLPDFGAFSIETQVEMVGDRLNLGALDLDLGGNRARGALEAVLPGKAARPSLSGTLAFSQFDFAGLAQAIAPAPRNILDLQRPLRVDFMRRLDMDLRLSAERALLGRVPVSEVAATVKVSAGVGMLDIGDMAILGGRGGMRFGFDVSTGRPALNVSANLRAMRMDDLAALAQTPFPLVAGIGDLKLQFSGPAANWGEILAGNRSTASLQVVDGSLRGFEREMMRKAGPHAVGFNASDAAEPFRRFEMTLRGAGPRLRFDDLALENDAGETHAHGTFDVRGGDLDLFGTFRPLLIEASGAPGAFTSSKPVSFTIAGEWPQPEMVVEAPAGPT